MKKVIVEWKDISKRTNEETFNEHIHLEDRLSILTTIGWLHQEDDKAILLVQEYDGDDDSPRDWIVIPKPLILKIKELIYKKVKNE